MIRTRYKKVILVTAVASNYQLDADYEAIVHVHALNRIFPAIHETSPNLIVFDYNFLSKDIENILRRLRANKFYGKIKLCCYKPQAEPKKDSLLKTLGIDYFVYEEELEAARNTNSASDILSSISLIALGMVPNQSN